MRFDKLKIFLPTILVLNAGNNLRLNANGSIVQNSGCKRSPSKTKVVDYF